jgi:glutathione synthase/RimK-type ligase-like ATP-grasp enzyme
MPASSSFQTNGGIEEYQAANYRAVWESVYKTEASWMNPYFSSKPLEHDKVRQARIAAAAGLSTIPTLFTSSPDDYITFVESLDGVDVVVKSPVSWHFEVDDATLPRGTYTRRLRTEEALALAPRASSAPVLVQPYIEKEYELRLTIVAGQVFACRIDSQRSSRTKIDWRHYDIASVPHSPVRLDEQVSRAVVRFMDEADLCFAAIDMIVSPDGAHVFVEANPSGQFGWIESLTEFRITDAIADWMTGAVTT